MGFATGSSCFSQIALHQSLLTPSSSSSSFPSFFLYTHTKSIENKKKKKKKKKNRILTASLRQENLNETDFCTRRAILFVGFSSLPLLLLRARAVEGLVKEERDVKMPGVIQNVEKLQGEASSNPFISLLNAVGIIGSGVLGALYVLAQKEKTAIEETIESMQIKLDEKKAAMASLEKNFERKLLNQQEELAKQIRKAKEEQQSMSNQLVSANSIITGLGRELQNEKRIVEELKSQIDRLQNGVTKAGEDKKMLEAKLKEKLNLIESLQERINLVSLEINDKEGSIGNLSASLAEKESECKNLDFICKKTKQNLAEANSEIEWLQEEVLKTKKELDSKKSALDDLNASMGLLIAERDDTNRIIDALREDYNDLKLSSEKKAAADTKLLVKREHEVHQLEEKLRLALNEATSNQALIADLTQERDDLRTGLETNVNNVKNLRDELRITQETLRASRIEASDLSKQLELSRKTCEELASDVSRVQVQFAEAQDSLMRSLDDARTSSEVLSGELSLVKEVLKKTKEELRVMSDELAAATEARESLKKELLDVYKKAEHTADDLKEEREMIASLNKELEASEKQILKDKDARRTLEMELEEASKSLDEMNRNAFLRSRDLETANSRINSLEDEKDMIYKSLIEQKNVTKESRENVEDAHNLVMKLGKEREKLEKRAKKLEEDLASAKGEILLMRSKINASRTLENDQDRQKSDEGVNNVVQKSDQDQQKSDKGVNNVVVKKSDRDQQKNDKGVNHVVVKKSGRRRKGGPLPDASQ